MKIFLAPLLLAAGISCAPPIETETTTTEAPKVETTIAPVVTTLASVVTTTVKEEVAEDIITGFTDAPAEVLTTVAPVTTTTEITTTTAPPPPPTTTTPPPPPPRLSGKEREALIAHLGNIDLTQTDKLVLTPRQRLAIAQELEYQQLGLQPFTDPTPWQRLSRQQQAAFNEKYLTLRPDLQEYSKTQFTSLSEERQEHAFNMFLSLDIKTLSEVIEGELNREREAAEQQRLAQERERQRQEEIRRQQAAAQQQQQRNRFQEQPRSQARNNFNQFNQIQQQQQFQQQAPQFQPNRQRPNFDPRRQRVQQQQQFQGFNQFQQQPQQPQRPAQRQPTAADQRHLAQAEAQIAEAVRLQTCLANPSACA